MKCLIADDAAHARELLWSILEDMGFDILEAADGEEAIRLAILSLPQVIVLNMGLPKKSGIEVVSTLRRPAPLQKTPIIALIAAAGQYEPTHLSQAGFSRVLVKPVNPAELRAVISEFTC